MHWYIPDIVGSSRLTEVNLGSKHYAFGENILSQCTDGVVGSERESAINSQFITHIQAHNFLYQESQHLYTKNGNYTHRSRECVNNCCAYAGRSIQTTEWTVVE